MRHSIRMLAIALMLFPVVVACDDDEDSGKPALGEACTEDDGVDACDDEAATCGQKTLDSMDTFCVLPAGTECAFEDEEPHCAAGNTCYELPDPDAPEGEERTIGRCLTDEAGACDPAAPLCAPELRCAELRDGEYACHVPVILSGSVVDAANGEAIEGAHVIALDDTSVAVTDVSVTDAEGNYDLTVPVVRNEDGSPVDDTAFTLRVSAADYQTFPGGIRQAIPILSSEAVDADTQWVIEGTLTTVELIALPTDEARTSISGAVVPDGSAGTLVVAHGQGAPSPSAIAALDGSYTIFNVTPGSREVRGYKAGLQLTPVAVSVDAEPLTDVDLTDSGDGTATISGSINIVNAPGGLQTSVVLAVEETFTEAFARGEVPAGVRTPLNVDGQWSIEGVPAGRYVVLAAFENDELVRDPDQNIAGTDTVIIDVVAGMDQDLADSFKITEALDVVSPGADLPEAVSGAVTLVWADDSSEDYYTVEVFNALGDMVWSDENVPSVSGADNVEVAYGGPLESGMYYQFRVKSWRAPGGGTASPISATEDLKGVFFVE